jgi:hypothetical protein
MPIERVVVVAIMGVLLLSVALPAGARWQPDPFLISYWSGPRGEFHTRGRMAEVAAWGATVVPGGEQDLEWAQELGLKVLLQNRALHPNAFSQPGGLEALEQVVLEHRDHPALYGYFIVDEPNAAVFPTLAKIQEIVRRLDPKHIAYVNLFPTYASQQQLGTPTYQEHVERFLSEVKPDFLSYDHYIFFQEATGTDYFRNLAIIRDAAQRHGIPWMNIVQGAGWGSNVRPPDEAELRFQVHTTLAYGARGLAWYVYWSTPPHIGASILPDGTRGPNWAVIQSLNHYIQALAPTLLSVESTGAYHVGRTLPSGAVALPEGGAGVVRAVSGGDAVVGLFRGGGADYVYLVNTRFTGSNRFRVQLDGPHQRIERFDGKAWQAWDRPLSRDNSISVRLAAGDGMMLRIRD